MKKNIVTRNDLLKKTNVLASLASIKRISKNCCADTIDNIQEKIMSGKFDNDEYKIKDNHICFSEDEIQFISSIVKNQLFKFFSEFDNIVKATDYLGMR